MAFALALLWVSVLGTAREVLADGPPMPTKAQLQMMEMGLSQFMHFSVDPFTSIEHNCVGTSADCIPAEKFKPTDLNTDQWVESAVAFGAGEICLTAHHEGGFCLWDTKYSNYSVMHSPYGKDVVAQFVASCKKYNVKPCYYMGPNANGYLANKMKVSADDFIERQLGMLRELLTKYGTDYVSRLWWDHYPSGCGGLAPCPSGSFPAAWPRFVQLVREVSPSTIICPGPDCDGHQGESGIGVYPVWFPCSPTMQNGTELKCGSHAPSSALAGFHPYEACATMHNGWFCKGDGDDAHNSYWSPGSIWQHYMKSVGIGWVNTLNAPPGTTGQIPSKLTANMKVFGDALRALLKPVTPSASKEGVSLQCNQTPLEIDLGAPTFFNAVMTREDLSQGQRITSYAVDYYDDASSSWKSFPVCGADCTIPGGDKPSAKIPSVTRSKCGAEMDNVNLVDGCVSLPCKAAAMTDNATACETLCKEDPECNFYTWHNAHQGSYARKCFLRYDVKYDYHPESGHFSGVCNHTLPNPSGAGVHGLSVGARLIDFVPSTTASRVRFRCTSSMVEEGAVHIRSFSVHRATPPADHVTSLVI